MDSEGSCLTLWGDAALGVSTANGVLYGDAIPWGSLRPTQFLWTAPAAPDLSGKTVTDLSLRH